MLPVTVNPILLPLFIAVTAIGVLIQAAVLLAIYVGSRQTERRVMEKVDEIREDIAPFLLSAQTLIEETGPKIRSITDNLQVASEHIREQVVHTNAAVADIADRTRHQAERVDEMVTEVLDTLADGTRLVQDSIMTPLRQLGGWLTAARSILDALRRPERERKTTRAYDEHTY